MTEPYKILAVSHSRPAGVVERTIIKYFAGVREYSLSLEGHNQCDEADHDLALSIVEEHLNYRSLYGVSNFEDGVEYPEDIKQQVESRLTELGYGEPDLDSFLHELVAGRIGLCGALEPDEQPGLEEIEARRVRKLVDRVCEEKLHLDEVGYLASILFHIVISKNDFFAGILWGKLQFVLKHEASALKGMKFDQSNNVDAASEARRRSAADDERAVLRVANEILRLAKDNNFKRFFTKGGKLKQRPLANAISARLNEESVPRKCGISKIEKILKRNPF